MKITDGVLQTIKLEDIVNGVLKIPEDVKVIKKLNSPFLNTIREVALPDSLEVIRQEAFLGYHGLESITIPKSVEKIETAAFSSCKSLRRVHFLGNVKSIGDNIFTFDTQLESVTFEEAIKKIPEFCFEDCYCLTDINLKEGTETIESGAFCRCQSLKKIKIPSSIKKIKEAAFGECSALEEVEFSFGLETIEEEAFTNCTSLRKIEFPESLRKIGSSAFEDCASLEEIYLPENLETIEDCAFPNLKCLKTPWGDYCKENISIIDIVTQYLYLYANHILKQKYKNIEDFFSNENISELLEPDTDSIFGEDAVIKFKNLFFKMRKEYDINPDLFYVLNKKITEDFDYKIWKQIEPCLPYLKSRSLLLSLTNMIEIFGIFHKDKNTQKRIDYMINLFTERPYHIEENEFFELLGNNSQLKKVQDRVFKKRRTIYYILDKAVEVPPGFELYLKDQLTVSDIIKMKKIHGTFGKSLNTFIKEHYQKENKTEYELLEKSPLGKRIRQLLFKENLKNTINYYSLIRMFEDNFQLFDEEFYQFMIDNMDLILRKEYIQTHLAKIAEHFNQIRNHYFYQAGIKKVSIRQAIDYIQGNSFDYHDGNYEFAEMIKKAGVKTQQAFEYYQRVFEENMERKLRSLIPRKKIYQIDGYTIQAELLRKDDPFAMVVGERNYANNCQVYHGMGHNCMAHATSSPDGGIFVTRLLKNGKWILLTESWDWKNNNLYCHDNIEGTPSLGSASKNLRKAVAEVIKLDAKELIEESKRQVFEYIEKAKRKLSKMDKESREKELQRLKDLELRGPVKLVTCGDKNDDLDIEYFFEDTIDVGAIEMDSLEGGKNIPYKFENFQPVDYNERKEYFNDFKMPYTDSNQVQYIIAGNIEHAYFETVSSLDPIYRDERKIIHENGINIKNSTVKKINDIKKQVYQNSDNEMKDAINLQNHDIYLGEDWYLIYEQQENGKLTILDLAKIKPTLEDEKGVQLQEMMRIFYQLMDTSLEVETTLRGQQVYTLYLLNKKLGYIEEIKSSSPIEEKIEGEKDTKVYFKKGPRFSR